MAPDFFKKYWREIAGAVIVLISRLAILPRTLWELDEFHFVEGVRRFDPSRYHPHPPGYPLYIGFGKAVNLVVGDPFRALVIVSVIACVIGFVALAAAFRKHLGDPDLAVSGALLFYFSAGMLVHAPLALSDAATLMCLALTFYAVSCFPDEATDRRAVAVGLWASAAIGCRPQICVPLLPALLVVLFLMRDKRHRMLAVLTFTFISLMWFLPLMEAAGGWNGLLAYETKQAAYFVQHDAAMSRGAKSMLGIATRFLLHPWGSKYVTIPLLFCLALGIRGFIGRWTRSLLPMTLFCAIHLLFALVAMDPADGVRYSLPAMIVFALIAACGFEVIRKSTQVAAAPWMAAAFFGVISLWYVHPIIAERTRIPSPVAAAAEYGNQNFAPNTVVLYQLSLRPQTELLLSRFRSASIDLGLKEFYDRPDVPLMIFADGGSRIAEARVFEWRASDAYGKMTRNVFRRVAFDPVRPSERYLPVAGIYALERTIEGDEWRWLARDAQLRLPRQRARTLDLVFGLSPDVPYETNEVTIEVNAVETGKVTVPRGGSSRTTIPLPQEENVIVRFVSARSFLPAEVLGNADPRTLAVQLIGLEQK